MRAIMVMFDSLNKRLLPNYGCDWTKMPNFERLAERTLTFDNFYAGSMPCMPARRELHTGRYNFLHRSWGPLEPFDDSMPELLKEHGIYTHLATDHAHYFEDGGGTYHNRYNSWHFSRGQEGDFWIPEVKDPKVPESYSNRNQSAAWRQDWVNRSYLDSEDKMPQAVTFANGLDFIERNHDANNWFLQIETFDPHEPFFTQEGYKELYAHAYQGKHYDWPDYGKTNVDDEALNHLRMAYGALMSMCDTYLGKVLDKMDAYNLWEDTMLIVNTDHGYMLGEKDWLGKNLQPWYNDIVNIPFFLYDPRHKDCVGERRQRLAQTVDIAPTILSYFNQPLPKDMNGRDLAPIISADIEIREAALFGMTGGHINVADETTVYMRNQIAPNMPVYNYTLMPTNMNNRMAPNVLSAATLTNEFEFTKGCQVLKIPVLFKIPSFWYGSLLFDLTSDPTQEKATRDDRLELKMLHKLKVLMDENEAPAEQYTRIGIEYGSDVTMEEVTKPREAFLEELNKEIPIEIDFVGNGKKALQVVLGFIPMEQQKMVLKRAEEGLKAGGITKVDETFAYGIASQLFPQAYLPMFLSMIKGFMSM